MANGARPANGNGYSGHPLGNGSVQYPPGNGRQNGNGRAPPPPAIPPPVPVPPPPAPRPQPPPQPPLQSQFVPQPSWSAPPQPVAAYAPGGQQGQQGRLVERSFAGILGCKPGSSCSNNVVIKPAKKVQVYRRARKN